MCAASLTDAADNHLNIIQGHKVGVSLSGRSSCLNRNRLCDAVCVLALVVLTSCGGGGGGGGDSTQPVLFTGVYLSETQTEVAVGFPNSEAGRLERLRVASMHQRGGTGIGQIVGVFESGVDLDHPDLTGQFQYICSMGHCNGQGGSHDDGRPSLDRTDFQSPLEDTDGHGTVVNGMIAARRNNMGVYGIAYEAKIASYGNSTPVPWDAGCSPHLDCNNLGHDWGSIFDQQTARGVDWMRSLNIRTINNSWTRTGPWRPGSAPTTDFLNDIMSQSIPAWQRFVNAGGVVVFAASNNGPQYSPDIEPALPHYFSALQPGWLAVGALGEDGRIAPYSQRCGIAADWCIMAPGEVITTELGGFWKITGGTSLAAPYVTASLAALKSLFPSLTYHQIRTRILATADKTGIYSNTQLYGQGRLNLDAASRPVGGVSLAVGTQTNGPVLPVRGAGLTLPDRFAQHPLADQPLLLLDGFQRAPFFVKLTGFIRPRPAYLSFSDLTLPDNKPDQKDRAAIHSWQNNKGYTAFGKGSDLISSFQQMSPRGLPLTRYHLSEQAAGLTVGTERWQFVAAHDSPTSALSGYGLSSAALSAYFATGLTLSSDIPALQDSRLALALSSGLRHPLGWAGTGAFEVEGQNVELGWGQAVQFNDRLSFDLTGRLTHLNPGNGPLLNFDKMLLMAADLSADFNLYEQTKARITFGREQPVSSANAHLRTAQAVSEDGRIISAQTRFSTAELATFDRLSLGLRHFTH